MTTKAERIAQLKAELAELEKEPEQLVIFDGWEPEKGDIIYWPNLNAECVYDSVFKEKYEAKFAFRNPKQAAAILDAFCVLMELRNQEGAGQVHSDGIGYVFRYGMTDYIAPFDYGIYGILAGAFICPCFPSQELCERAVNNVGRERVEHCLKLFAMVSL